MTLVLFAAGVVALVGGAELLVRGASKLAVSFVLPITIVTLVAMSIRRPSLRTAAR